MVFVWDVASGSPKQIFDFHKSATMDVDWKDNNSFASCSTDKMIYVCELGKTKPSMTFQGHTDEVNAVRWDPSGTYLASCSDDRSAKIWSMKSEKPLYDFHHQKEIYTIRWSQTGQGTDNPNKPLLLASASFDSTVKVWDFHAGKILYTFTKHIDPVYSVSFSPNGEFLASGSSDKYLHIYSLRDGSLVKSYLGGGGIFEVCWNATGNQIAACFSNKTVSVVDFRI